jgi:hypothetical protein
MYNAMGIFDNEADSLDDLHSELSARFTDVRIETHGAAALFRATDRPESGPGTSVELALPSDQAAGVGSSSMEGELRGGQG